MKSMLVALSGAPTFDRQPGRDRHNPNAKQSFPAHALTIRWMPSLPNPTFDIICPKCGHVLTRLIKSDSVDRIERANHLHNCSAK